MTVRAWRLSKEKYASDAFSGEGAKLNGGRWNSKGTPMVYTSEHISLAVLEILVGLEDPIILPRYVLFRVEFEEGLVEVLEDDALPGDWRLNPPPRSTQEIGDRWVSEARSAVLCVSGVVIPSERNYLLNPRHSDFGEIAVGDPKPHDFDPRLHTR
jgi:RES domain-containing protein